MHHYGLWVWPLLFIGFGTESAHAYEFGRSTTLSASGPRNSSTRDNDTGSRLSRAHASTTHIIPRQQDVIDTVKCKPATALVRQISCRPISFDKVEHFCGITTSTTVGCNVKDTAVTTTLPGNTLEGGCAQDGCGRCVASGNADAMPTASPIECQDCTTRSGRVYASQATAFPSGNPPSKRDIRNDLTARADSKVLSRADEFYEVENGTLIKRTLITSAHSPFDGDHDKFMVGQINAALRDGNLVPHRPGGTDGRSSAKYIAFHDVSTSLAVDRLNGCTSVVVISRKGAWMSHFWEKPTFMDKGFFQEDVLLGMWDGDESGWFPGLNQHSQGRSIFNTHTFGETDNKMSVFIITPYEHPEYWGFPDLPYRYLGDIVLIRNSLQRTFNVQPKIVTYPFIYKDKPELDSFFQTTAAGKIVLQYDPKQYSIPDKVVDDRDQWHSSCHQQWPMVRLYVGTDKDPIFEDSWKAIPDDQAALPDRHYQQIIARDQNGKLSPYACVTDEDHCPVCVVGNASMPSILTNAVIHSMCAMDPAEDQGTDGYPSPVNGGLCPVCTSDPGLSSNSICGPDPNDDQGQDGEFDGRGIDAAPTCSFASIGSQSSARTTMNNNSMVHNDATCACDDGMITSVSTVTGLDAAHTYLCPRPGNATAVPITTVSENCSITTMSPAPMAFTTRSGGMSCACGGSLAPLVSQSGTNGAVTLGCSRGSKTIPVATTTATPGIAGCRLTTEVAMIYDIPLTHPPSCACPTGTTAYITSTVGQDKRATTLCWSSTSSVAVATAPPTITSCKLTISSIKMDGWTQDSGPVYKHNTQCECDSTTVPVTSTIGTDNMETWICQNNSGSGPGFPASTGTPKSKDPTCKKITKLATTRAGTTDAKVTQGPITERALTTHCSCSDNGFHTISTSTGEDGLIYEKCMLGTSGIVMSTSTAPAPSPTVAFTLYTDKNCQTVLTNVTLDSLNTCTVPQPNTGWLSMLIDSHQGFSSETEFVVYPLNNCNRKGGNWGFLGDHRDCINQFGMGMTSDACERHDCFVAHAIEWYLN